MKKFFITLLAVSMCIGSSMLFAADYRKVTKEFTVERDYTALNANRQVQVILDQRPKGEVLIDTDARLLDYVTVKVRKGVLEVSHKDGYDDVLKTIDRRGSKGIVTRVYISAKGISRFKLAGMARLESDRVLEGDQLTVLLSGMGRFDAAVDCASMQVEASGMSKFHSDLECSQGLVAELSGMSEMELEGSAAAMTIEVSGMSTFDGRDFEVRESADVEVSGMSKASVKSMGTLKLDVGGMSKVTYNEEARLSLRQVSGNSTLRAE